eukprot:Nk52_evm5s212 gene=Nk52_evmTU5s212
MINQQEKNTKKNTLEGRIINNPGYIHAQQLGHCATTGEEQQQSSVGAVGLRGENCKSFENGGSGAGVVEGCASRQASVTKSGSSLSAYLPDSVMEFASFVGDVLTTPFEGREEEEQEGVKGEGRGEIGSTGSLNESKIKAGLVGHGSGAKTKVVSFNREEKKKAKEDVDNIFGDPWAFVELDDSSDIIKAGDLSFVRKLASQLPMLYYDQNWRKLYSSFIDGDSLTTFYRRVTDYGGPSLLFVRSTRGGVFGCFASEPWRRTEGRFCGSGECFLFEMSPNQKIYRWSGQNELFMVGGDDCISMGGGRGHAGLWINDEFSCGSSQPCDTFNNQCLSEEEDFKIIGVEVWGFKDVEKFDCCRRANLYRRMSFA